SPSAMARPMPAVEPVTTALRPVKSIFMMCSLVCECAGSAARRDATPLGRARSIELDEVLENKLGPAVAPRLDQRAALVEPSEIHRRVAQLFRQRGHRRYRGVVVAGQKDHPPSALDRGVFGQH